MDRKQFMCGACACAAGTLVPATEFFAEEKKPEDWRLSFVKRRYAKLWEILAGRMDEPALKQVFHELGTYCSSLGDEWINKHQGDFESFCASIKQSASGDNVTYDRKRDVIVMTSQDRSSCFCPLNSEKMSGVTCECSLGWQQHTWGTFLQRKVKVELKEAVLRGGKRCTFEVSADDGDPRKLVG